MDVTKLTGRAEQFETGTHEIDGVGTVTFRGMTRWELHEAGRIGAEHGAARQECFLLARCMVDPPMSEADVKLWQNVPGSAGEMAPLQRKINVLSKIGRDAAKSDVQSDGEGPES